MMTRRSLASFLALAVVAALASPGIAALCAVSPGARAHACCAASNDCGTLTASPPQMRCCETAPIQAPAGSQQGVLSTSWALSFATLPAAAQVLAHASSAGGDALAAYVASLPDPLSALSSPLRR